MHVFDTLDAAKMDGIAKAVKGFADALRAINPDLILGYMPADHHPISAAFDRSLATDCLPAILDAWDLYNGEGYSASVKKRAEAAKKVHPNNRFVPWLRPNSYRPDAIAVSAYHAAKNTDGYSNWTLLMLDAGDVRKGMYGLPPGTVAADYLKEYKRANDALKGLAPEIPYAPIQAIVPTLDFSRVKFPAAELLPSDNKASGSFVLREFQTLFIRAKKGETVSASVRHMAGMARATAVHYAVLASDGTVIRDESVSPGGMESFTFPIAADGVYALVACGGEGGQAWYSISVKGAQPCHDARVPEGVYLFGPQRFRVMGSDAGNPTLRIRNSGAQAYRWRMNGGEWHDAVKMGTNDIALPHGIVTFEIARHPTLYCQDIHLYLPNGKRPFVMP